MRAFRRHSSLETFNLKTIFQSYISFTHVLLIKNKFRYYLQFKNVYHKHNPWGKPGGGAPNHSVRMRNIKLDGLYPETGQVS